MRDAFYDFDWPVAPRYEWREFLNEDGQVVGIPTDGLEGLESASAVELTWNRADDNELRYGPVLTPTIPNGTEPKRYRPMQREHAALFREFGDVDYQRADAVLEFASRYGLLGVPWWSQFVRYRASDGEEYDHHAEGESHLQWALEICFMREGIRLAGRRSAKDTKRFKWLFDRNLQHVQGRLGFDQAGSPRLLLEPLTLIAAMWLQLALALTGDKRFEACKFCRRTFEISTDQSGFRSHREFCSDSCKTNDYRRRKRTALRLAADGDALRAIAEKTKTDSSTVQAWISAAGGRTSLKRGK